MVDFDDRFRSMRFLPVEGFLGAYLECEVGGMNSAEANKELQEKAARLEAKGKVVVIRVAGELAGGKTTEVDLHAARKVVTERGAVCVYVNRNALTSREQAQVKVAGEDAATIERNLFKEGAGKLRLSAKELTGEGGADRAVELLRLLRQGQRSNELKKDYSRRVVEAGAQALIAKELLEEPA